MKRILTLLFLFAALGLHAQNLITATVTITNTAGTTNGMTIIVNGVTRTWTNVVTAPSTQILTNAAIGGCATNLFNAYAVSPAPNVTVALSGTNAVKFFGQSGAAMAITVTNTAFPATNWGAVSFTTNTITAAQVVRVPFGVEGNTGNSNVETGLVGYLNDANGSGTIAAASQYLANFVNVTAAQTISGVKIFSAINGLNGGVGGLTNGSWMSPTFTNAVNKGNAFSSAGGGANSEQFGSGAAAAGNSTLAIGAGATTGAANGATAVGASAVANASSATSLGSGAQATGVNSIAIAPQSSATGVNSLSMGKLSSSSGTNSTAFGTGASASGANSMAFGEVSSCSADNSFAIGVGAVENATNAIAIGNNVTNNIANEITMGSAIQTVRAAGNLAVSGNAYIAGNLTNLVTAPGTNTLAGQNSFPRYNNTALASGANQDVSTGTNVYVKVSGPGAAFSIVGLAGGADGRIVILENATGQAMTIANDSGLDTTPTNRIYTGTGADIVFTANPAVLFFTYDSASTHWVLFTPATATVSANISATTANIGTLTLTNALASSNLVYRSGVTNIPNLSTSVAVVFSTPLPSAVGTNYWVGISFDTAIASAVNASATSKTTNGFTITLSAGIAGTTTVDYAAWPYQ